MTACDMVRERKGPSAPGEVPEEVFSDGGSTPPASTKGKHLESFGFQVFSFGSVFIGCVYIGYIRTQ